MVESIDSLPTALQHTASSHNNTAGCVLKAPVVYDFDSDDEDGVYAEEAFEAVLPLCANFDSLSREDAGKLLKKENCNGMYLVRASLNVESGKVLSVWYKGKCRHYKVYYDQATQTYTLGADGDNFSNITTVIAYYMLNDLPKSKFALTVPYGREARPIRIRSFPFQIKFKANRKQLRTTQQIHIP